MKNDLLSISELSKNEIIGLIKDAEKIKRRPKRYRTALSQRSLLTFFQMPSLRTMISFDVAMSSMGGNVVNYQSENSPWAKGKESIEDVARVISRYVDCIMVRMHDHSELVKFSKNASIPVINGLTSYEHPCQILSDLLTIKEKKNKLAGLKLAYFGDSLNNVTHSLLFACAILGIHISIACPKNKLYSPDPEVLKKAKLFAKTNNHKIEITSDTKKAAKDADIIYTDSWMSYRISPREKKKRVKDLKCFQVDAKIMKWAKKDAIFMDDLPALRGMEVTAEVIDGKQSVVYDQAENRLHMQKAILLKLMK
jgi:ornithine carbamoyltransferase